MFLTLSAASLAYVGAAAWLDRRGRRPVPPEPFDAIVVLGCRVMPGGRPSGSLEARAVRAAELWLAGAAPRLVTTGGVGDNAPSEARVAADVAIALGVDPDAIVLEDRSTTTEENAREARVALRAEASRVLVVTDGYHTFRAERVFRRHFEEVHAVGTVAPTRARVRGALREVTAVAAYFAQRRL